MILHPSRLAVPMLASRIAPDPHVAAARLELHDEWFPALRQPFFIDCVDDDVIAIVLRAPCEGKFKEHSLSVKSEAAPTLGFRAALSADAGSFSLSPKHCKDELIFITACFWHFFETGRPACSSPPPFSKSVLPFLFRLKKTRILSGLTLLQWPLPRSQSWVSPQQLSLCSQGDVYTMYGSSPAVNSLSKTIQKINTK